MSDDVRPEAAPLFDAAIEETKHAYGPHVMPKTIAITTYTGMELTYQFPPDWVPDDGLSVLRGVDCFAETFATIFEAGRRMTRAELLAEMARKGRKRAESAVCASLEDLTRLGIIDNRQDTNPKGYNLRGSD